MPLSSPGIFPQVRMRRLRRSTKIRNLVRETDVDVSKLVMPLFIKHGSEVKVPIASMPGIYQLSIDNLEQEIKEIAVAGIRSVLLFGIPAAKDPSGQDSYSDNGIVQTAITLIKKTLPNLTIISDVCFCEYTDHGHCGVIDSHDANQEIDVNNDKTLELLAKQAVSHAKAGTDIIAPSGSMDGMVQAIRLALDAAGFHSLPILSYSVKYASALYGPFRHAAEGAPKFGDRRTYQMDVANANEAVRECALDIAEGADMLMVKPAHTYLDVILRIKQTYPALPLAAYHVSGEYSMVKAAAEKGWIDEKKVVMEVLTGISRAGADFIITYYAKEVAMWMRQAD
jgi:porphobilinogen synthase